jgi:hypothetical protein
MRFDRQPRYEPKPLTDRQRGAYARKLSKEKDRYPLFPDHVAAEQRTMDAEEERRVWIRAKCEKDQRDSKAAVWRKARGLYFGQPADVRARIQLKWRVWTGPCTATYFAWMVDVESGEQARRLARLEAEFAPIRKRIRQQVRAEQDSALDFSTGRQALDYPSPRTCRDADISAFAVASSLSQERAFEPDAKPGRLARIGGDADMPR